MLINLNRLVIEHFDSLINRIDIHTEEQLKKYSSADILGKSVGNPNGPVDFKKEKIEIGEDAKSVLAIKIEPTESSLSAWDEDMIEIKTTRASKKKKIEIKQETKPVLAIKNEPTEPLTSLNDHVIEIEGVRPTLAWDYFEHHTDSNEKETNRN